MRRTSTIAPLITLSLVALACVASPVVAQQTATLETGLTADRTIRYEIRQQYETVQTIEEQQTTMTIEQFALLDLVVESTDQAGNAVVRIEPLSYSARLVNDDGPMSIAFDLDTPRADGAEQATGILGLEQSLALAPMRATLRADGTVIRVTGLDEPLAMVPTLPDIEPNLVSFFDPDRLADLLNAIFSADSGIGQHERGDSWTATKRVSLGVSGTLIATTETTLSIIDDASAGLAGVYTLSLEEPAVESDSAPRLVVDKSNGQIITQWDLEDGSLMKRTANINVALVVSLGEELRQKTESNSTTNINRLPRQRP